MAFKLSGNTIFTTPTDQVELNGLCVVGTDVLRFEDDTTFQGSSFGYVTGGDRCSNIFKYTLSNGSPASCSTVGTLNVGYERNVGVSSTTCGYSAMGFIPPGNTRSSCVERFPFASDTNATSNPTSLNACVALGFSFWNSEYGTVGGGFNGTSRVSTTDKIRYSNDVVSVGDFSADIGLTGSGVYGTSSGVMSSTDGYTIAGQAPPPAGVGFDNISRFPFATGGVSKCVGELGYPSGYVLYSASAFSKTHGYTAGGNIGGYTNQISKFPFGAAVNVVDVGDLTACSGFAFQASSQTHGYSAGGSPGQNRIDSYPFASDTNATCLGILSAPRAIGASNHV